MNRVESRHRSPPQANRKRSLVGLLAVALIVAAMAVRWAAPDGSNVFAVSALTRIGLVLGALWLAWDSLRRPARWLPPGIAALGILGLLAIASQPRLAAVLLPAIGLLIFLGVVIRLVKR